MTEVEARPTPMADLEQHFLAAAVELTAHQVELYPKVAEALGLDPFAYWIRGQGRGSAYLDSITRTGDGEWRFHFHGIELDLVHVGDGRRVRVDFAPGGRLAFTPGGVGEFVRCATGRFPDLAQYLCGSRDYADHRRCVALADALVEQGRLARGDPRLMALIDRYTRVVPGKGAVIDIPPDERPADPTDLLLCDRYVLAEPPV
ncbi:MAG: hypothetical protein R3B09_15870 [Nannocystaceae bacterium]